ncbi:MAG TPA: hypothetical protein VKZ63_12235 [Kofleriaceae bacterium]|nr:hypothetical protein [Kofleriaceae bacterium]
MRELAPLMLVATAALACGGQQRARGGGGASGTFECFSRRAEYMVVGAFVAPEAGVSMLCDGDRPRLVVWRVDASGQRSEESHELTEQQFESTWEQIDSTGWRYLDRTCDNPQALKGDPIYTIDLADDRTTASLTCTGKELPFPYDRLVNELDLRAAGLGNGP